jgi:hypothetical protein
MTIDRGAMYRTGTPTVAMVSATIGTPNIMYAIILRLVWNGMSATILTTDVAASGIGVVVVTGAGVVVVVVASSLTPLKAPQSATDNNSNKNDQG